MAIHALSEVDDWPQCRDCAGIRPDGFDFCLAHLSADERDEFLRRLEPGADLDLSGTTLSRNLLRRVQRRFWLAEQNHFAYGTVSFVRTQFPEGASFSDTRFNGHVRFVNAQCDGETEFRDVWFRGGVNFTGALFGTVTTFGVVRSSGLFLSRARFTERVEMTLETDVVMCHGTRFDGGVTLRLTSGELDAPGAIFGAQSSIAGILPVPRSDGPFDRPWNAREHPRLVSLVDADVSNLRLSYISLAECGFAHAYGLEQLRITGHPFGAPPMSWRWTRRDVLAEEAHWRGWKLGRSDEVPSAETLAGLYRSLRKSLEDSKNEAGAGDFYYGEMEMRRHSANTRWAERRILDFYWLLSGYGQRAGRALAALVVLIATVAVLLAVWGQPAAEAAQIAVGAVVFRDPGTKLTEAGQWTVMVARFLGPVLLALAVLAVRARVKR